MTFKEMYLKAKSAPKEFIKEVQVATRTEFKPERASEPTIRGWLSGTQKPTDLYKVLLQKHFNAPFEELFPNE